MIIRPYTEKDRPDVRFVCLNSEGPNTLSEETSFYILTTYCDYFIEKEGRNCFVVANEHDRAVGYIICAENYDKYKECFDKEYVTRFSENDIESRNGAKVSAFLQEKYKNEYPAHLHIDILPEYHRMGLGHKLVDTLTAHLKSKGVSGVMLTAGTDNAVGRRFYNKYGFTLLEESGEDAAYGLKLD